jgi:hypothetical protein
MQSIRLVARNPEVVRQALEQTKVLHLDTASEEITDQLAPVCHLKRFASRLDCGQSLAWYNLSVRPHPGRAD